MKQCTKCDKELDRERQPCRDCWNAYRRAWRAGRPPEKKDKEQAKRDTMRWRYGLTPEDYDSILESQGGTCATCPTRPDETRFHIDHDHACCDSVRSCGKCIRGILCHNCNTTLGHAKDDVNRLESLVNYLKVSRL